MRYVLAALIAASVLFGTAPANAFLWDFDRVYVEARAGLGLPPRPETEVTGAGTFSGEYREEDGFAGAVTVGAYFGPNTRAEVEFGWTHGEDGDYRVSNAIIVPHTGDADVYTGMLNFFYEINIPNERWRPYVGAGVGFAVFDIDNLGGGGFQIDDTETTFNAALHTGIDVPINETFIITTRITTGVTTAADFDTTVPGINVKKDTQVYAFFSAGIRIILDGLMP